MKYNYKHIGAKSPLATAILGIGMSLAFVSTGHSAPPTILGPEITVQTPANGPFAEAQPPVSNSSRVTGPIVSNASVTSSTSEITVRYASPANPLSCAPPVVTWLPAAQTAFSFAANIWANRIHSTQPIVIDACWTDLAPNILGSAGPRLIRDFGPTTPVANTWYPFGVADALAQTDIFPGSRDISASFNQNFRWYFGTDRNPPANEFDFVTVVLHEIGHGLGFTGGANVSGGAGTVLLSGFPTAFSRLTKDGNGLSLLDDYTQGSQALGNALTGGSGGVFFHGTSAMAANGGQRVPLFDPSTWNPGSSYSHLDESFNGTSNSLMTFSVSPGVAQHVPGLVSEGLLKDIGWPTNNDLVMSRALGGFSYDPSSNNPPFDARGTLTIDFDFTNTGSEGFTNFYLLVHTANSATLNNATTTDNNGGVGSVLTVSNFSLPGGDRVFSNGETLTVPLDIDIAAGGRWGLDFSVLASDQLQPRSLDASTAVNIASFSIDSSMFEDDGLVFEGDADLVENNLLADEAFLTANGCSLSPTGASGRIDPLFALLLAGAVFSFARRRKVQR